MSGLKALTMMQLKDKVDMSYLKSTKKTIFKVVLSVVKFAIITALIWVGFFLLDFLNLVSLLPGIPQNFFTVVFTIMMLLSIIVSTYGQMKALYFGKDNQLLLTLPANKSTIFSSKILVHYFYELIRNLNYIMPLLLAYGIINAMPVLYWIWLIPAYIILTAVPVVIGALLSIPAMLVAILLKNNKWLQYPLVVVCVCAIVLGLIGIITIIPDNFDLLGSWGTTYWEIQDFINGFCEIFAPFGYLAIFAVGERNGISNHIFTTNQLLIILFLILGMVAVMAITFVLVRPIYFKMASVPFEFKKVKVNKIFANSKHSPGNAIVRKEGKLLLRDSEKLLSLGSIAIALPISILLLNKIFAAMDTRFTGMNMAVGFNILLILLIALSSNARLSYIYSEEGASSYLNKTSPQTYLKLLFNKLVINMSIMSASILATTIILAHFQGLDALQGIELFAFIEFLYLSHMLISAELDIMNPQNEQYQTTGGHANNPNETKSTILGFVLSALFAFLTYFFVLDNYKVVWLKMMLMAGALLLIRVWLYINKIKVYYKEK